MRIQTKRAAAQGPRRGSAGYSLIEVLVSMAIGGVGIVALYGSLGVGTNMLQASRENLRATQILVEKMEAIRLYTFDQLVSSNGFIPSDFVITYDPQGVAPTNSLLAGVTFHGHVIITNAPVAASYQDDMRLVTVNLDWTSSGMVRHRDLSTLVSRNGLQNYIY